MFQSTHLREVRLTARDHPNRAETGFNPRTCVRCDITCIFGANVLNKFQYTHLREVRPYAALSWMVVL